MKLGTRTREYPPSRCVAVDSGSVVYADLLVWPGALLQWLQARNLRAISTV